MKTTKSGLERLKRYGYRCIHLFGNVYLVRNYSVNAKQFSLYGLLVVRKGEQVDKKRAIKNGFCSSDCEEWYKCPVCKKPFGSWTVFHQEKNENGTNKYCPHCKIELPGLD